MSPFPAPPAHPLVAGVIGRPHATAAGALLPEGLSLRAAGLGWALFASDAALLETRRRSVCWGRYLTEDRRPRDAEDAAFELGLAGLWDTSQGVRLHTDAFGVQDVFLRELDGALWFSNRIGPLRDLGGPLDADDDAWGASLGFGGFIGSSTPFRQISRLCGGGSVVHDGSTTRFRRANADWLGASGPQAEPADLARAFLAGLPGPRPRRSRTLTLSGGWDSRLIVLGLQKKKALPTKAWTVHHDDGSADDVVVARHIAAQLGLDHSVAETGPHAWVRRRSEVLERFEHLSWLHTWLEPMARRVRAEGLPVLDGLGGDALLRASSADPSGLDADDREALLWGHWGQLTRGRLDLPGSLDPDLAQRWRTTSYASMAEAGEPYAGHPAELTLRTLSVRTSRVIALSPLRLFAPELPVLLPFLAPRFVRAAASVPTEVAVDRSFYRSVLYRFDPAIAGLPSTNDGVPRTRIGRPLSAKGHALDVAAGIVEDDAYVLDRLHPRLRSAIGRRDHGELRRARAVLHWAAAYADWRRVHADVLSRPS